MNKHTNPITIDRQGPVPARATTSITLTAGAMIFPLSIYTAVSDLSVSRSERLNGDPAVEVGRTSIRKDTGEVVNTDDVTRMAQASTGEWVVVTDAELAEVYGSTGTAEVVSFVPVTDAGRYVTDGIMQVRASKDKRAAAQAANEQAFSLLLTGMRQRQVHALVRFVMRGGPRYGLLTADGDMLTIIPAEAVRAARLLPIMEHDAAQVDMMGQFIDAIGVTSELVNDDTPTRVQAFIDKKAAECGVTVGDTPVVQHGGNAQVGNDTVMAALEASIAAAKATRKAPAKKGAARSRKAVAK
jgi:non-homologous end joining protein Ku